MRTSKPFSTISWNSERFLISKLDDLVCRRVLDFWVFVQHYPEEDETKAHKHLYLVPNGYVFTDKVVDYLSEFDPTRPDKPIRPLPCSSSKFGDWYLYACHDSAYLASKGQARKYHYAREDFTTSDHDYFGDLIHRIDYSRYRGFERFKETALSGVPFGQMVADGLVPVQQLRGYELAYQYLVYGQPVTDRAGRSGHDGGAEHDP